MTEVTSLRNLEIMKRKSKYIRKCEILFSHYGKESRQYVKGIEKSVNAYLAEHPDAGEEELEEQFGDPKEVLAEYMENVDTKQLTHRILRTQRIKKALYAACIVALLALSFRTYNLYQEYLEAKDSTIIHVNTTIEED